MSILSWLKNTVAGQVPAPLEFADQEEHLHGLDMKVALDAHTAWKARLESQIRGDAGETLNVATVAADSNCALGQWIHGDGKRAFADYPEYDQLRKVHADFHLCAGGILSDAHDGKTAVAEDALRRDFRHHSDAVQLALVRLYAKETELQRGAHGAHR